ncbi:MAG: hypothetical protein QOG80_1655 [Pseudonocardiales bacterium]|nr:hypothetical protein [Pseudonocardiales bacterium]
MVRGVLVTSIARTLADLARTTWASAAVAAMDHALRRGWVGVDELDDVAAFCRGWPGARGIPVALAMTDRRAESPLESCSRLVLDHVGLPRPELQASIRTLGGRFLGRADFYWDDTGVVGEADGRNKYTQRDVLVAEKLRQERLEQAGLVVVRWTWTDMRYSSGRLKRRIERAFERGRARDAAALPRQWSVSPLPTGE